LRPGGFFRVSLRLAIAAVVVGGPDETQRDSDVLSSLVQKGFKQDVASQAAHVAQATPMFRYALAKLFAALDECRAGPKGENVDGADGGGGARAAKCRRLESIAWDFVRFRKAALDAVLREDGMGIHRPVGADWGSVVATDAGRVVQPLADRVRRCRIVSQLVRLFLAACMRSLPP